MRKLLPALLLCIIALTGCTQARFEAQLRETLRNNPEIVYEAIDQDTATLYTLVEKGAKARQIAKALDKFEAALEAPMELAINDARPMKGNKNAPVTVVAFTDFQCGYCGRGALTLKNLMEENPSSFRYVAKHAPMSETGEFAARLFEAIGMQDSEAAWKFYYQAFAGQQAIAASGMANEMYFEMASRLEGIDAEKLKVDMGSDTVTDSLIADATEFSEGNFRGVPVYFVNGAPIQGAYPASFFKKAIDLAAGKAQQAEANADEFTADEIGSCLDCIE